MDELKIINDESQIRIATETIETYEKQIKFMESEVKRIKKIIHDAMVADNYKVIEMCGYKFNRITPFKKTLKTDDATNFLIEKDLLENFQMLDEKKVMASFPEFVEEVESTECLKITKAKEK